MKVPLKRSRNNTFISEVVMLITTRLHVSHVSVISNQNTMISLAPGSKGLFTLTAAMATETQIFFPSRMGYIGPHGSVHTETSGKGNGNP